MGGTDSSCEVVREQKIPTIELDQRSPVILFPTLAADRATCAQPMVGHHRRAAPQLLWWLPPLAPATRCGGFREHQRGNKPVVDVTVDRDENGRKRYLFGNQFFSRFFYCE
jgi:hypothetical protein